MVTRGVKQKLKLRIISAVLPPKRQFYHKKGWSTPSSPTCMRTQPHSMSLASMANLNCFLMSDALDLVHYQCAWLWFCWNHLQFPLTKHIWHSLLTNLIKDWPHQKNYDGTFWNIQLYLCRNCWSSLLVLGSKYLYGFNFSPDRFDYALVYYMI